MARPTKHQQRYKNVGRPTKITKDILNKLEQAFAYCYTDEEACLYVDISPRTLYNYQDKNPEFVQRKELLRKTPNLHAKEVLVKNIDNNLDQSRWWAKNKMGSEFSETQKVEHSGNIGDESGFYEEDEDMENKISEGYRDNMQKRIMKKAKDKKDEK